MRAKPSVAHLYYANVLVVALLAASVAISESVRDGVPVDTLNAAPAPVLIKRYLKSYADTSTSDHTNDYEERAVPSSLESLAATAVEKLQAWWWQPKKTPENQFDRWNLGNDKDKLFENPYFPKWVNLVKATAQKTNEDPIDVMFRILSKQYEDDAALAKALVAGVTFNGMEDIALKLLDVQLNIWKDADKPSKDVFGCLMLDHTEAGKLFKSSVFPKWVTYVKNTAQKTDKDPINVMFMVLSEQYKDDEAALAKALAAAVTFNGMKDIALKLLDVQLSNWKEKQRSAYVVYEILGLHHKSDTLLLGCWLIYVKNHLNMTDLEALKIIDFYKYQMMGNMQ